MQAFSLLAFVFFFGLSGLGVFLAERLVRSRGQAFLRSYSRHLALWDAHALVQIMQVILGAQFLPSSAWAPLGMVAGPVVFLFLGASLYFLLLFAAQIVGCRPPRFLWLAYASIWIAVFVVFALTAGSAPPASPFFSLAFFLLKMGTVLTAAAALLIGAAKAGDRSEKRSRVLLAWTYLCGFLLFQLSVSGAIPLGRLPGHDYWLAFVQIGFHFPVLAALAGYARRRAAAGTDSLFPSAAPRSPAGTGLTPREAEIVGLVMRGLSNKEIEKTLFISLETVKKHLSSIYRKLGVRNRLQLSLFIQSKP